jgi:hypothetical protein
VVSGAGGCVRADGVTTRRDPAGAPAPSLTPWFR